VSSRKPLEVGIGCLSRGNTQQPHPGNGYRDVILAVRTVMGGKAHNRGPHARFCFRVMMPLQIYPS
jgi:hypothetical protein